MSFFYRPSYLPVVLQYLASDCPFGIIRLFQKLSYCSSVLLLSTQLVCLVLLVFLVISLPHLYFYDISRMLSGEDISKNNMCLILLSVQYVLINNKIYSLSFSRHYIKSYLHLLWLVGTISCIPVISHGEYTEVEGTRWFWYYENWSKLPVPLVVAD